MIWKTIHLNEEAKQSAQFIPQVINTQVLPHSHNNFRIVVVGGGPKGMYAIDQLSTQLKQTSLRQPIDVFWLNRDTYFGCGPNYHILQPDYLLINYCIGHIDAWIRSESGDTDIRPDLMDWIRRFCTRGIDVQPTDFASRALVGYYLLYCVTEMIRSTSPNMRLFLVAEEVKDMELMAKNHFVIHTDTKRWPADNVLLATGHCYTNIPLIASQAPLPSSYMPSAYPVSKLDTIPDQSRIGIAGLGLTFIDVALHLTEGRGGTFGQEGDYIPSGREPILYPFSRNHLPILPRGPIYGNNTYQLHYLNTDWIKQMNDIHRERKIDFLAEIYPLLEQEVRFAYYSTLLRTRQEAEVEHYIHALEDSQRFGIDHLLFPIIERGRGVQESYIDYIEHLICEAEKGENQSPLMAAAAVWREATPIIGRWYEARGFTGESQRKLDKELFGALCRTSFGPPICNMKKILALLKAGVIQMVFEDPVEIHLTDRDSRFILKSETTGTEVDVMIDARIARPNLDKNNANLYRLLSQNHLLSPLENEHYRPGCPSMDADGRSIVDGQAIPLYFYGSNTEGFLLDNDSLSRTKNNMATQWVANTIQQIQNLQDGVPISTHTQDKHNTKNTKTIANYK